MKQRLLIISIVSLVAGALACSGPAQAYVEQFNTDNAGWEFATINNSGANVQSNATWNASGGNGGGYISAQVNSSVTRLYSAQPGSVSPYGNLTGDKLTTDFMTTGTVNAPVPPLVRFYVGTYTGGNNYFVSKDAFSWNPNLDTAWTTHQVVLSAADFEVWPNQNANSKTFAQVIAAPEDIGLVFADGSASFTNITDVGFSSTAGATLSIDNFGSTPAPEPMSLMLAGLGLSAVAGLRRRTHAA